MKHLILSSIAVALLGTAAMVMAADKPKSGPTTKPAATQPAGKPVNKWCAVEGKDNEIDPKVTIVYKGKVIGFCCRDCLEKFEKDPEKYVKRME